MTICTGKLDLSASNRKSVRTDGDVHLHKTMVISPDPAKAVTPNAFLVEQPAGATIRPHFHTNSQWLVFVGGSGMLGRRAVQGYVAQYVAPHTGYGPIVAGEDGLWYFTLRPSAAAGAKYLPESHDQLDMRLTKRQVTSPLFAPGAATAAEPVIEMIAPQQGGLAAWMLWLAPGSARAVPKHAGGLARYYVVTQGEMIVRGEHLGPLSLAWVDDEDLALPLQAGCAGLSVLALQFPGDAR